MSDRSLCAKTQSHEFGKNAPHPLVDAGEQRLQRRVRCIGHYIAFFDILPLRATRVIHCAAERVARVAG